MPSASEHFRFFLTVTRPSDCFEGSMGGTLQITDTTNQGLAQSFQVEDVVLGSDADDGRRALLASDFDFDGREDFAINQGCSGPYGTPTYSIYLQSPGAVFSRSKELSQLAERSLGALVLDAERHTIRTASKSGCCFHWFEWHEVRQGHPQLLRRQTMEGTGDAKDPCRIVTEEMSHARVVRKSFRDCSPWELE